MSIFTPPGTRVIFNPSTKGLKGERGRAILALEDGKTYTVRKMIRRADKADVYLEEVPGAFAAILFEEEENE
jgi:hypothetical protein